MTQLVKIAGKMKVWKKVLAAIVFFFLAAGGYGWYLYTKSPADIRKMDADFSIHASRLVNDFKQDESKAVERYVDKILIVSGRIAAIEKNKGQITIALDAGDPMCYVACSFYSNEINSPGNLVPGATIQVKGNCTGMLTDVVLNKCSLVH